MTNYTSFYGGEKKSFYGFFIQNTSEERVLKRGPSQTVLLNAEKLVQLLSLTADFYPIQSGNGQPSPENIRAISGRTFADVCISPTLDAEDGKIYHVIFPTQVGTAYGGTIDMINKTLTINYLYKMFTGQEDWEIYFPPRTAQYCRLVLGEHGSVINDSGICSHFPQKLITSSQFSIEDGQRIVNSSAIPYAIICIRYVEKQKTVDEFKDWLREQYNAGTPVQVAYKISNPTVYNINIDSVTLYPNNNNIWIENGDITIQYKINKNVYYNTVNGNPCILDESVNTSITNLLLNIQSVQSGSGDPSSDNVRPITGWTGAKVMRRGKNLFPNAGDITVIPDRRFFYNQPIILKGQTVTLSASSVEFGGGDKASVVMLLDKNNGGITHISFTTTENGGSWTATEDIYGLDFYSTSSPITSPGVKTIYRNVQLELGDTATDYEPYQGETYSVAFPSEAGTVYGGMLDVTRGVLTVTHKFYENAGTGNWAEQLTGGKRYYIGGVSTDAKNLSTNGISNIGELVSAFNINGIVVGSNGRINICGDLHDAFATVDDLKAYFAQNPLQLVYELASPVVYQLTPTQINALDNLTILTTDVDNITVIYKAKNK